MITENFEYIQGFIAGQESITFMLERLILTKELDSPEQNILRIALREIYSKIWESRNIELYPTDQPLPDGFFIPDR